MPTDTPDTDRRLRAIADLLEAVDYRCMAADGPVTPTRLEITNAEMRDIYRIATGLEPRTTSGRLALGGA